MGKKYCKICGAEWEENFDECWNCGMPENPGEISSLDTHPGRRLRQPSRLNRGIYIPLILGIVAALKVIVQGGFKISTLAYDIIGLLMLLTSLVYIIRAKLIR